MYHAKWRNGELFGAPVSKVVCVGRNYAKHAEELGNAIPEEPILFIKPETSIQHFGSVIQLHKSDLHYEAELALLIGEEINAKTQDPLSKICGVGLALDLTDRSLQSELKSKGYPWERAKGFDGATVLSEFEPIPITTENQSLFQFEFAINQTTRQHGKSSLMLFSIEDLIKEIAQTFTLRQGDVVLTGTPEGVGVLSHQDHCSLKLFTPDSTLDFGSAQVVIR